MKKIMLVEDDHSLGKALKTSLESNGYEVVWIEDGESVIAELDNTISLVYLDIILPGILDGYKVLEMIKGKDSLYREIPVVMVSNESDPESINKAINQGASDFLVKSNEKLEDIIKLTKKLIG